MQPVRCPSFSPACVHARTCTHTRAIFRLTSHVVAAVDDDDDDGDHRAPSSDARARYHRSSTMADFSVFRVFLSFSFSVSGFRIFSFLCPAVCGDHDLRPPPPGHNALYRLCSGRCQSPPASLMPRHDHYIERCAYQVVDLVFQSFGGLVVRATQIATQSANKSTLIAGCDTLHTLICAPFSFFTNRHWRRHKSLLSRSRSDRHRTARGNNKHFLLRIPIDRSSSRHAYLVCLSRNQLPILGPVAILCAKIQSPHLAAAQITRPGGQNPGTRIFSARSK